MRGRGQVNASGYLEPDHVQWLALTDHPQHEVDTVAVGHGHTHSVRPDLPHRNPTHMNSITGVQCSQHSAGSCRDGTAFQVHLDVVTHIVLILCPDSNGADDIEVSYRGVAGIHADTAVRDQVEAGVAGTVNFKTQVLVLADGVDGNCVERITYDCIISNYAYNEVRNP